VVTNVGVGVDVQELAEMQKEMLEEVGKYPGITTYVVMPLPAFSLKSGNKHVSSLHVCVCVCVCVCV